MYVGLLTNNGPPYQVSVEANVSELITTKALR
jgi:hypothetical protein